MKKYDVAVIGGGIVGLGSSVYCGRLNLKTIVFARELRGTLVKTHVVENYPGFKSISGFDLTGKVLEHAKQYKDDVEIIQKEVTEVKKGRGCFKIITSDSEITAKNILFASGSKWRKLNAPGEGTFMNKGVHYCALCDAPFYKNKTVAVVGGSDAAAKEALLLSKYAKKVYMFIRSHLKAEPINAEKIKENSKIEIIEGIEVEEIKGEKKVKSVTLTKKVKGKKELDIDGLFIAIGHVPNSKLAKNIGVKVNKKEEIIIDKESKTNVPGVYAAGDVTDTKFKQAITGVGEGVKAIYGIYNRLGKEEVEC
ncbi:alkyl hydroperoxide reductase [Candidatus Pacearchaeota archaeon]|nr:alkyl hydroperoxide reductase [Candidatus Pacearchaeota archaeon]